MLQSAANGGSSTGLLFSVIGALWLLGLGSLLIHIGRGSGPRDRREPTMLAASDEPSAPPDHVMHPAPPSEPAANENLAPPTTSQLGVTILTTSVVPAATATKPNWDPDRNAWVSQHPEFGLLVLNPDTNRWSAASYV